MQLKKLSKRVYLPSRIAIAVTGHRDIKQTKFLQSAVNSVVEKIQLLFPTYEFTVYSCLAEGADQLLGRCLQERLPADLYVVLPLPELEYLKDFRTVESIKEYSFLKSLAKNIVTLPLIYARPLAYRMANQFMLERSDIIVTIWDGKPAKGGGGTGEMISMARHSNWPLIWIQSGDSTTSMHIEEERFPIT